MHANAVGFLLSARAAFYTYVNRVSRLVTPRIEFLSFFQFETCDLFIDFNAMTWFVLQRVQLWQP